MMKAFKPDSENSSDSNESSGDSSDDSSAVTSVDLATAKSIAEKMMLLLISSQPPPQQLLVMESLQFQLLHLLMIQAIALQQTLINLTAVV